MIVEKDGEFFFCLLLKELFPCNRKKSIFNQKE